MRLTEQDDVFKQLNVDSKQPKTQDQGSYPQQIRLGFLKLHQLILRRSGLRPFTRTGHNIS